MSETMVIPWYATGFRADAFEYALGKAAAVAMRYNATSYAVYRSSDDRYRFQQLAEFEDHHDWVRYWESPEMTQFRATHSGWYQVPVLYGSWQRTAAGGLDPGAVAKSSSRHAASVATSNGAETEVDDEPDADAA
jgi:hypothetical protein